MKTPKLFLLTIAISSLVLTSCSKDSDSVYSSEKNEVTVTAISNSSYSPIESKILELVNNHRSDMGLSKLTLVNLVSSVAGTHTDYMIENGQVSHDNFQKRSQTLIAQANAKHVGENVAFGYSSAEGVLKGWLNSEGHRKIIENPNFTHFGISTEANSEGRNYFTHMFIQK